VAPAVSLDRPGRIDRPLAAALGISAPLSWPTDVATLVEAAGDALEVLARRLLIWRTNSWFRTVVIASAYAGEGRTSVAMALAHTVVTKVREPVLMVEADVFHPSLAARLGAPVDFGLDDEAALGRPSRELVLWGSEMPLAVAPLRHRVLPAARDRVAAVVRQVVQQPPGKFALVLIDAPPLRTPGTIALDRLDADSAVLVTRPGLAGVDQVNQLRGEIQAAGLELVGMAETFVS
jgi:Mrp family chromosome partitioning ATPase